MIVGDTASLANDSDVLSLAGNVAQWAQLEDNQPAPETDETQTGPVQDQFHSFNTRTLAIRDASYIRSRFSALYITADNIDSFMQSTDSKAQAKRLATSMLVTSKTALRVEKACLDGLELMWTGTDRESTDLYEPSKMFLARFTISAYLIDDWQLVLELGYVAIAEETVDTLLKAAEQPYPPERPASTVIPTDVIHVTFRNMRDQYTPAETLQTCLSWKCLSTTFNVIPCQASYEPGTFYTVERANGWHPTAILEPDRTGTTHNLIWKTYKRFKIGRQEPSSSLIRMSSQVTKQIPLKNRPRQRREFWDFTFWKRQMKGNDICLATCTRFFNDDTTSQRSGQLCYCLYTLNETLTPESLATCIEKFAILSKVAPLFMARLREPGSVARTCRRNWDFDRHELTNPDHKDLIPYLQKLKESLLNRTGSGTMGNSRRRARPNDQHEVSEAPGTSSNSGHLSRSPGNHDASGRRDDPIVLDPPTFTEVVASSSSSFTLPKRTLDNTRESEVGVGRSGNDEADGEPISSKRVKVGGETTFETDTLNDTELAELLESGYFLQG